MYRPNTKIGCVRFTRTGRCHRRGTVAGLMVVLLPVLAIIAAFCINAAQMQLARTELSIATDAAARAGGRTFSELQSVDEALDAARITAALNTVAGAPLQLRTGDGDGEMQFGATTQPDGTNGRFEFFPIPTSVVRSENGSASAFRVLGRRDEGSLSGASRLVIPGLLGVDQVNLSSSAVAMQVDRDIALVLDRSGSMQTLEITFPSGTSPWFRSALNAAVRARVLVFFNGNYFLNNGQTWESYQQWAYQEHFNLGPAPLTLWESLVKAVDAFLLVLEDTVQEEQVSVASYSSNATLDSRLEKDFSKIRDAIDGLSPAGNTAIGRGMLEGIQTILDSAARPFAAKTMVVMTDGVHNTGVNPRDVARFFVSQYDVTIHTVVFGENADRELMAEVAEIGQGEAYVAEDGEQLIRVFEEIANNLPTILTQ